MKKLPVLYIALSVAQFIVAIICAPQSCAWGNSVYFFIGLVCLAVAFILPMFHRQWKLYKRRMFGLLFALVSVILWCAGFMLLDFKIICRLF